MHNNAPLLCQRATPPHHEHGWLFLIPKHFHSRSGTLYSEIKFAKTAQGASAPQGHELSENARSLIGDTSRRRRRGSTEDFSTFNYGIDIPGEMARLQEEGLADASGISSPILHFPTATECSLARHKASHGHAATFYCATSYALRDKKRASAYGVKHRNFTSTRQHARSIESHRRPLQ